MDMGEFLRIKNSVETLSYGGPITVASLIELWRSEGLICNLASNDDRLTYRQTLKGEAWFEMLGRWLEVEFGSQKLSVN